MSTRIADGVINGTVPDLERRWRQSLDELRRMKQFAADRRATLVLVAIPSKAQAIDGESRQHYQDVLRDFASREHVRFVDLLDGVVASNPRESYWTWDQHFTARGPSRGGGLLYDATKDWLP